MINLDDDLAVDYLAECCEHMATVETGLLAMEGDGEGVDDDLIHRIFRAVHSLKGGAVVFDLVKIRELAHRMEDVLALIRIGETARGAAGIRVLLRATDRLNELIRNAGESNQADISEIVDALAKLLPHDGTASEACASAVDRARQVPGNLRMLLVEDDFVSRLLLQTFLSGYGECHIAVNGREAVEAYCSAWDRGQRYNFVCMDIMMPEMDGCEAVRRVRAFEESHGVFLNSGAKIIMTTTVREFKEVIRCFKELCDAYLIKPIDLGKLLGHMKSYRLVQ